MKIQGKHYKAIWFENGSVYYINQKFLPFKFEIGEWHTYKDVIQSIKEMEVRGAPLIGIAACFGMYLAMLNSNSDNWKEIFLSVKDEFLKARPTAVNIKFYLEYLWQEISMEKSHTGVIEKVLKSTLKIQNTEIKRCEDIGRWGLGLIKEIYDKKKSCVNILTHCNAGWLAVSDYGTVTAPIYMAQEMGIPLHVWVSETRPKNQGSKITAWELSQNNVDNTIIADNASGYLIEKGLVDIILVGADRVAKNGDTANKIGTMMKAIIAKEFNVPFYVVMPSTTYDPTISDGSKIPIEIRNAQEITCIEVIHKTQIERMPITLSNFKVLNPAFDVTPAQWITGYITELGILNKNELHKLETVQNNYFETSVKI